MKARVFAAVSVVVALFAGGVALWATPQGAAPQASQAVVIKGRAPVSSETLKLTLPRTTETDLGNGLHLMVLEDRRVPQVSFQLLIRGAGGYYDPADTPGLSTVTATMMREGTPTRTTQQIAERLETMAASVVVSSGLSGVSATVSGSSLTENFDETFALAADILLHPTFPKDELDRYRTRTKAGLVQQRSQPGFLATEMFSRVIYGTHPASRISITAEVLDRLTPEALSAFHKSRFVPDHAVLAIAGDLSMAEARKIIEPKLVEWKKSGTPLVPVADPPAMAAPRVYFIARPNSVQTSLYVGTQAIARTSPDYDAVSVMNTIIGVGPTGRLFTHLREEKGYTYGASSSLSQAPFRGAWVASTDVRTEVTEPALRDLLAEVTRMRDELVPTKEFDDRRRSIIASFALSLESANALLNLHVTRWLYGLPIDYWDTLPARTMAVTQAQVQAAARKYLDPTRLQIVAVGDPTKVAELLKQFGTVETYDANGKRVP
jgi:zinc protease